MLGRQLLNHEILQRRNRQHTLSQRCVKTVSGREVLYLLIICVFTSLFVITIKQMVPKKIVCSLQLKSWQAVFLFPNIQLN